MARMILTAIFTLFLLISTTTSWAIKLSDYSYYDYDIRFTNPVCKKYNYEEPVLSVSGKTLISKPENVFCTHDDMIPSASRPGSPQYKLVEWINDPETKEIFFTYLSFSNSAVRKALCKAVESREVKITFVLDNTTDLAKANELEGCMAKNKDGQPKPESKPKLLLRGHSDGIGYAHNKMFLVNPRAQDKVKIAFSSGNMTSGVAVHHENWHFITINTESYFAQAHLCLMEGELNYANSKAEYSKFIRDCKGRIKAKEEDDIKSFFVPGEGDAATKYMTSAIYKADKVYIGAHRFSYNSMLAALRGKLDQYSKVDMRIIVDDDTYWAGKGDTVGDNSSDEYYNVTGLQKSGAKVKYMETNHAQHLLHHNKFLVFQGGSLDKPAVFAGAGNLTGAAFRDNWENFYYITIPSVVDAFVKQYDHLWNDLATAPQDLPRENVLPFFEEF